MRTLIKNVTILTMNEHFDVIEDGQMLIAVSYTHLTLPTT